MRVVERSDKEYMEELREMYDNEVKPLLNEGMSLTGAFNRLNVHGGAHARKYRELKQMALDDGYQLRERLVKL